MKLILQSAGKAPCAAFVANNIGRIYFERGGRAELRLPLENSWEIAARMYNFNLKRLGDQLYLNRTPKVMNLRELPAKASATSADILFIYPLLIPVWMSFMFLQIKLLCKLSLPSERHLNLFSFPSKLILTFRKNSAGLAGLVGLAVW